ncbi:unnamed protein product [Amoebophrya sp. A120]|nr:unnamed protein product [Amoebophrya sp. A120]|eukprot:GSA120T00012807001.1
MASLSELPAGEAKQQQSEERSVEASSKKNGSASASPQTEAAAGIANRSTSEIFIEKRFVVLLRKAFSGEEKKFCVDAEKVKCFADLAQFVPQFYTQETDELCPPSSRLLWLAGEDEPAEDRDSTENHAPLEDGDGGEQGDPPQLPAASDASAFFAHSDELVFNADGEAVYRFMVKVEGPSGNLMEVEESSDDEYSVSEQEVPPRRVPQKPEQIKNIAAAENWLYDRLYRYFLLREDSDEFEQTYGRDPPRAYYPDCDGMQQDRRSIGAVVQALLPLQYSNRPHQRKFECVAYPLLARDFERHLPAWRLLAAVLSLNDTEWIKHGWLPPGGISSGKEQRQQYCEKIILELANYNRDSDILRRVIVPALDQVTNWDGFPFAEFAKRAIPVLFSPIRGTSTAALLLERVGQSRSRLEKICAGCKSAIRHEYKKWSFKPWEEDLHQHLKTWVGFFVDKLAVAGFPDLGRDLSAFLETVHDDVKTVNRQVRQLQEKLTEPEGTPSSRSMWEEKLQRLEDEAH